MMQVTFRTQRVAETIYRISDQWGPAFREWLAGFRKGRDPLSRLVVISDTRVWGFYSQQVCAELSGLDCEVVPILYESGESAKSFLTLPHLIDRLLENHVHRRDLLLCLGGGVCCDMGGLLAMLYMRGLDYVIVPTSLMAQLDAAIGGKVGANFGGRKNLVGGFHQPLLVLLDPSFLQTLPACEFVGALSEAVKLAIARQDDALLDLLTEKKAALLNRERLPLLQLLEKCLTGKLALLEKDPYEYNLDRVLNLGHALAHTLESVPQNLIGRELSHGEAVAIGLAAVIRYGFQLGLCSPARAGRLLGLMRDLGLPLVLDTVDTAEIKTQLQSIPEHRGGLLRLVVPADEGGPRILPRADMGALVDCMRPVPGLEL